METLCKCRKPIRVALHPPYCMSCGKIMKESKFMRIVRLVIEELKK